MKKLEIEFHGHHTALDTMTVNGKRVKIKKKEFPVRTCQIETDKDKAEVIIYQTHHYIGKAWFWWSLLYHFVSLFGLFDMRQNKRCQVIDCRLDIDLKEDTKVNIKINDFVDGGKFALIEENVAVKEVSNIIYNDQEAQKKHKKMKKAKTWITLLSIVAVFVIIMFVV